MLFNPVIRRDDLIFLSRGGIPGIPGIPQFSKGGKIFNPLKQLNRTQGGVIPLIKGMTKNQRKSDSMYTKLSCNDLVIPVNQTAKVKKFLKDNKLDIKGKPARGAINAITMPREIVIANNKTIPKVIKFLKSKNIFLPNTK